MSTALERLLAHRSAIRHLRRIFDAPDCVFDANCGLKPSISCLACPSGKNAGSRRSLHSATKSLSAQHSVEKPPRKDHERTRLKKLVAPEEEHDANHKDASAGVRPEIVHARETGPVYAKHAATTNRLRPLHMGALHRSTNGPTASNRTRPSSGSELTITSRKGRRKDGTPGRNNSQIQITKEPRNGLRITKYPAPHKPNSSTSRGQEGKRASHFLVAEEQIFRHYPSQTFLKKAYLSKTQKESQKWQTLGVSVGRHDTSEVNQVVPDLARPPHRTATMSTGTSVSKMPASVETQREALRIVTTHNQRVPEIADDTKSFPNQPPLTTSLASASTEWAAEDHKPSNSGTYDYLWWARLLDMRSSTHGVLGIRGTWYAMRRQGVDLPTHGSTAEYLWDTFLSDPGLLLQVAEYTVQLKQKSGEHYGPVYETMLRSQMLSNPKRASELHGILNDHLTLPETFLQSIASSIPVDRAFLKVFRTVYLDQNQKGVYDTLMARLLEPSKNNLWVEWHHFLLENNDLPKQAATPHYSQATPKTNEVPRPIEPSDSETERIDRLCAKLFATRMISVDTAIKTLGTFGVQSIGPTVLRELALRLESPLDILQKIDDLATEDITIRRTAYTSAIERFAIDKRADLLRSLLESDQHPDVLDDWATQDKLLSYYIYSQDYVQVERTLHILTLYHSDRPTEAWNKLLQVTITRCNHMDSLPSVERVIQSMFYHRITINRPSQDLLRGILRKRRRRMRPHALPPGYDEPGPDALLLVNVYLNMLKTGQAIRFHDWLELFKRVGMTGTWQALERMCIAVADAYSNRIARVPSLEKGQTAQAHLVVLQQLHAELHANWTPRPSRRRLGTIFHPNLLRAIIAWGFRSSLTRQLAVPQNFTRGLKLLRALQARGVAVPIAAVRSELRYRFTVLYGSRRVRRLWMRGAKARNPFSLGEMVVQCESAWGRKIFGAAAKPHSPESRPAQSSSRR